MTERHKIDFDKDILYEVPAERRPRGGCVIRRDPSTESDVIMYRNDPGIYYSANGLQVSETMAKRAGYDTVKHAKEREKKAKMMEFQAKWDVQHQIEDRRVVATRGAYKLVHIVDVGYHVEHEDGTNMTPTARAQSEQAGLDWLTDFAGPEEQANGDVSRAGESSGGRVDRRPNEDGGRNSNIRQSGNQKAPVQA